MGGSKRRRDVVVLLIHVREGVVALSSYSGALGDRLNTVQLHVAVRFIGGGARVIAEFGVGGSSSISVKGGGEVVVEVELTLVVPNADVAAEALVSDIASNTLSPANHPCCRCNGFAVGDFGDSLLVPLVALMLQEFSRFAVVLVAGLTTVLAGRLDGLTASTLSCSTGYLVFGGVTPVLCTLPLSLMLDASKLEQFEVLE